MTAALLLVALLATSWFARKRLRLDFGSGRSRAYLTVAVRQVLGFALPALVMLALVGEWRALSEMPASFAALAVSFGIEGWITPGDGWILSIGALAGTVIGSGLAWLRWRRKRKRGPIFGELGWLLPRDRADLAWGVVLSLTAGVTEELFFRLALPLLATLATGSALAGLLLAAILFAGAHWYQGWSGVVATGVMGLVFALLYLASGTLWFAIAAHIVVDLNALVIRPALTGAWRRA
ncbi:MULTISPECIES: CPBP family intramembrane glutamic endopeptidase [unclassified Sphingomonas]|uniref:CPBP family intramembrane glutamic endopeptidase n=1 Tax=unclassified Sphingomonas TaxID=196159 RepID=UPI00092A5A77|nr:MULTISPECIES: CPBP family intramembrane glutamic endopeptidase [unclassified Sphingomonas]OJU19292.1 MAG: hypothetical protein BGN95_20650 [Sphingomonas sp. 66-10]